MRILVEILHPAHVHFFRNAIKEWTMRGDDVLVLSREKDVANELLRAYDIPFESISRLPKTKLALVGEMVLRDVRMLTRSLQFKPDVLVGIMGVTIAQVAKIIRRPAIVFYDTENAVLTNKVVYPLAHSVCTPQCYTAPVNGNHVKYPSYHELAYLHPRRFQADPEIVRAAGVEPNCPFYILRFVSWQASHDVGEAGFDVDFKRHLVQTLLTRGKVLISSEGALPADLEQYRFNAAAKDIHHFLACATLLVGESATMASEAAVLGTPAFYIADTGRGYTDEQEQLYQLCWTFPRNQTSKALQTILELLETPDLNTQFEARRRKMLSERTDATSWLISYIDEIVQKES